MGKTTISYKLASKLDASFIGITELVKTENLVISVDDDRDTLIADTQKVSKRLQQILVNSEDTVVVEGHYVVDVVPKEFVDIVFVLRRDPQELKITLKNRGYSEKKVYENLAAEILDVCLWDAISVCGTNIICEVDVSGKTVAAVVEEMVQVLENSQQCRVGVVDWLAKLDAEGQLDEFLRKIG